MNPAEQSARDDAQRHGTIVGSDVDRVEQGCRDDLADDDEGHGAWLLHGESPTLWGTDEGGRVRTLSLCTGYGGLDLAVEDVFGAETVMVAEVDPSACAVIEARFPGVPNLGDLTAVDWSSVPPVDVLTAGYPCQPFSTAGRRQGANDARHLWPFIAGAIGFLRPRLVVLENVAGHLSLGFGAVLGDLAEIGYDARWRVVRASDVGACHRRARLFVLAHATQPERRGPQQQAMGTPGWAAAELGERPRSTAPDADNGADDGQRARLLEPEGLGDWGAYGPAIERHAAVIGRPAPDPVDGPGRLNPVFVEWMMMLPEGWVTDVLTNRSKALHCLGNGVVPPQAAYALRSLTALESAA